MWESLLEWKNKGPGVPEMGSRDRVLRTTTERWQETGVRASFMLWSILCRPSVCCPLDFVGRRPAATATTTGLGWKSRNAPVSQSLLYYCLCSVLVLFGV